ncbi:MULTISPECIES: type VI secretion system baseplate subunit TssE [Sphingomonas]|uniref:Type VI secretion system baseplate subunit TssE n=1 Tax=Sphingomonas alpina TaxID=653931 RepID=A0A7H0LIQ7_9SPHN|nr:type VI secretion system baseplate subunit TssE [Sphingomonas alpina]QNQ09560.1 type VI secretion system baseplate subunit TssE [Sphingomonas alpina]
MAVTQRLTPTLFDKLVADLDISGMRDTSDETPEVAREKFRYYSVPKLERFNEAALRATIRRDLAWLLNTTNLESLIDLEPYPRVAESVLNFGLTDLAGRTLNRRAVLARAREIRRAIRLFEPRLNREGLTVDPVDDDTPHALTYLIQGDITSAAQVMPVKFRTEVEAETATVNVRE